MDPEVNSNSVCFFRQTLFKHVWNERGTNFTDKVETDSKVDLKTAGYQNNMEKEVTLDGQK